MKILIVNFSDIEGGASRAAYRLHKALLYAGVESKMLVQSKSSDDFTVIGPDNLVQKNFSKVRAYFDTLPQKLYKDRTKTFFSTPLVPFSGIANRINSLNPDIVHLHWISSGGMMSIEEIKKIKAPIVWSLHDMWPFTGGCHYDENCGGYKNNCGTCKVLNSKNSNDLSSKILHSKTKNFKNIKNLTIIGLSKWLTNCAAESTLFSGREVVHLPNPIDTHVFSAVDQQIARDIYNLPKGKKLILFGAMFATSDPRKGFKELYEALTKLQRNDIELVIFGSGAPKTAQDFKFKAHYLGHLQDTVSLKILYSSADVVVVPSLQENLSNAILESLSCGVPVVGFDIGGNSDMIEHQINGYLAKPFDTSDLAKGIDWTLSYADPSEISKKARSKVLETFESRIVVQKYIKLYEEILSKTSQAIV